MYSAILYVVIYEVLNAAYRVVDPRVGHERGGTTGGTGPRPGSRRLILWRNRSASLRLGVAIVVLFALASLVSLVWTPYPPDAQATGLFNAPPSWQPPVRHRRRPAADVFSRDSDRHHHRRRDHSRRRRARPWSSARCGAPPSASSAAGPTADPAAAPGHELVPIAAAGDAGHLRAGPRPAECHPRRRAHPAARLRTAGQRRGDDQEDLAVRRSGTHDRPPAARRTVAPPVPNSTRPLLAYAAVNALLGRGHGRCARASSGWASSRGRPSGAR